MKPNNSSHSRLQNKRVLESNHIWCPCTLKGFMHRVCICADIRPPCVPNNFEAEPVIFEILPYSPSLCRSFIRKETAQKPKSNIKRMRLALPRDQSAFDSSSDPLDSSVTDEVVRWCAGVGGGGVGGGGVAGGGVASGAWDSRPCSNTLPLPTVLPLPSTKTYPTLLSLSITWSTM